MSNSIKLENVRNATGATQEEFAAFAGVHSGTYGMHERDEEALRFGEVKKIVKHLNDFQRSLMAQFIIGFFFGGEFTIVKK